MTLAELIAQRLAQRAAAEKRKNDAHNSAQAILDAAKAEGRSALTPDEDTRVDALFAQRKAAKFEVAGHDEKIAELRAVQAEDEQSDLASHRTSTTAAGQRAVGGAIVTREERTYTKNKSSRGQASFFSDSYRADRGDFRARERLDRHMREVEVEGEARAARDGDTQERAQTTTTVAGLVVPQYLVDDVALLIRGGRPFANSVLNRPLPDQGMSFVIPRGTTGAAAASQTPENNAVQNTDEVWANLTVPVVTIAGQQDVSRQALERGTPGIDELVYMDLAGAYHAELDRQALAGSGASNQMLGVQNTAGIGQAAAYAAALGFTTADFGIFNRKLAGVIAGVAGTGAGIQPRLIVMHPRRWGWLNALTDSAGRPLIEPIGYGAMNAGALNINAGAYGGDNGATDTAGFTVVGSIQGLPIITDANVPIAVGTGPEDLVWAYDPTKILLWEDGDGMPNQLRFEQTLGNQLTVKLVIYGYAAFTAGRYPTASGQIGGNSAAGFGQVTPVF